MNIFKGGNFSEIYYEALKFASTSDSIINSSRNGPVKDLGPAYFEIVGDCFRMPMLRNRRFNPFFALTEFSWFITGSNVVEPLQHYVGNFDKYSDDGSILFGAYGYRLRNKFLVDQISQAVNILKNEQNSRRVVLSMWGIEDLGAESKDIPCNTSIMFKIREGKLDITVINRSNDLFLGIPYNIFMFYLLQCYMAKEVGIGIGTQRHFTDSLHLYETDFHKVENILTNNSILEIRKKFKQLNPFSIEKYIEVQHQCIVERDFKSLNNGEYKEFFNSYKIYIETGNIDRAINTLSKDYLGYAGYLWFTGKRDSSNTPIPSFHEIV